MAVASAKPVTVVYSGPGIASIAGPAAIAPFSAPISYSPLTYAAPTAFKPVAYDSSPYAFNYGYNFGAPYATYSSYIAA